MLIIKGMIVFLAISAYFVYSPCVKAESKVIIRGQVVYEPTRQPLKGVLVKLLRPHRDFWTLLKNLGHEDVPDLLATTTTDSNGYFLFETGERGPYEINCFRGDGHFGSGQLKVDPNKFVLIEYPADRQPEIWHGNKRIR
jgi:hypothetical protein